jgi:soluble cytochrome b562
MSLKLDELRKRLLQQPMDNGSYAMPSAGAEPTGAPPEAETLPAKPELKAVEPAKSIEPTVVKTIEIGQGKERPAAPKEASITTLSGRTSVAMPKAEAPLNQNQLVESVAKLFEQTKTFQVRFDELTQAIDVIERLTESAGRLFGPLRAFHTQLSQLSASFESMRAFQIQLAELGKTFEPIKIVHDQFAQLSDSIQSNLAHLVKALDPAKDFRDRIMTLAQTLDQANELQADFGELYSAFRAGSASVIEGAKLERNDSRQSALN